MCCSYGDSAILVACYGYCVYVILRLYIATRRSYFGVMHKQTSRLRVVVSRYVLRKTATRANVKRQYIYFKQLLGGPQIYRVLFCGIFIFLIDKFCFSTIFS